MEEILSDLSKLEVGSPLMLKGTIVVGRDIAHSKFKEIIDSGKELPEYLKNHPIYYAGPAKTPPGKPSGSFGPTTAGRMDSYVDLLQSHGGSMVMIAKGNRSQQVTDACQKHGGFYLGSIGGPAARKASTPTSTAALSASAPGKRNVQTNRELIGLLLFSGCVIAFRRKSSPTVFDLASLQAE